MPDVATTNLREQADRLLPPLPPVDIDRRSTAMLTIDMQYVQHPDHGLAAGVKRLGLDGVYNYYTQAIREVISRVARLQDACRAVGLEVIHVRIEPRAPDGRDYAPEYRMLNENVKESPLDSQIMREVAPRGGEMVLTKVTANAFISTNLDQALRHMGIGTLIVAGVVTNGCVESTVRSAADRGYRVILASDGCSCWTEKGDVEARRVLRRWFAQLVTTEQLVSDIRGSTQGGIVARSGEEEKL